MRKNQGDKKNFVAIVDVLAMSREKKQVEKPGPVKRQSCPKYERSALSVKCEQSRDACMGHKD